VAEATISELEVNLGNAERSLVRVQDLYADGVASEDQLDTAQTEVDGLRARLQLARQQLEAARAQLAVSRQDLENYTIRAPFAGIAVSKDAQPGEMVSPVSAGGGYTRTGISTIVDMSSLEIEVDVNESYIARVAPGQQVEATLDAYPEWRIPATVRTIIPTADRQKATVKVRIAFDQLDPRILPDMGVKVAFLEATETEAEGPSPRALVPTEAVRTEGGTAMVFVLDGERLERRAVSVGRERGSEVEILAGVQAGEQVVVAGPEDLEDGQQVRIKS
jgi:RND family efflux transporter MFP subunit